MRAPVARPRGVLLSHWAAELRILLVAVLLAAYFRSSITISCCRMRALST